MTPIDYFKAMLFVAPALCSLVCALFVVMLIVDFRNSGERRLRIAAVVLSLVISVVWFVMLIVFHTPSAHGIPGATWHIPPIVQVLLSVLAFAIPIGQVWLTYHIMQRRHTGCEKPDLWPGRKGKGKGASANSGESSDELSKRIIEEYFKLRRPYLDPEFKLTDLAEAMGVNRSEISSFINRSFGINFKRYVNRWRLFEYEKLMALPSNELKNPYKVVLMAGFSDTRHYHRVVEMEKEMEQAKALVRETEMEPQPKKI